jgi:hypothetical protein
MIEIGNMIDTNMIGVYSSFCEVKRNLDGKWDLNCSIKITCFCLFYVDDWTSYL